MAQTNETIGEKLVRSNGRGPLADWMTGERCPDATQALPEPVFKDGDPLTDALADATGFPI